MHTHTICIHTHTLILRFDATFQANGIPPALSSTTLSGTRSRSSGRWGQVRVKSVQGLFFTKTFSELSVSSQVRCRGPVLCSINGDFLLIDPLKSEYVSTCFPNTFYFDSNIYVNLCGRRQQHEFHMGWIEFPKLHGQEDGSDCREWRLEGGHGTKLERMVVLGC